MKPEFITFTGIDEHTDLEMVRAISNLYPVEWGILFSPKRQGKEPRYPSLSFIDKVQDLSGEIRLSAHLCGLYAQRVLVRRDVGLDLSGFQRAQINCVEPDVGAIADFAEERGLRAIAQHRTLRFPEDDRIDWLYDKSGGKGISPSSWPICPEEGLHGYAGGMGPNNVAEIVRKIAATGPYWIDMESRVRTKDWLDLTKCMDVCEAIY